MNTSRPHSLIEFVSLGEFCEYSKRREKEKSHMRVRSLYCRWMLLQMIKRERQRRRAKDEDT
jgi:hypothetical protein